MQADNYVLSQTVPSDEIEIENPPSLERQALVPPSVCPDTLDRAINDCVTDLSSTYAISLL